MSRGKGKRYKEEEIIRILRERENGVPVGELLRKHNVSAGTYYRRKSRYAGMEVQAAKAAEEARERKQQAQEDSGGPDAGHRRSEGDQLMGLI